MRTAFELSSFTRRKAMTGPQNLEKGNVILTTPIWGTVCSLGLLRWEVLSEKWSCSVVTAHRV